MSKLKDTTPWISWWLSKPENAFMCAVDECYIRDRFNLFGLDELVPGYEMALNTLLNGSRNPSSSHRDLFTVRLLYGLIHARFIMTPRGVDLMLEKYFIGDFGTCPRINCILSPVLPMGLSDEVQEGTVILYCPKCDDAYAPSADIVAATVDGAFFGTGFPHMVFMTKPEFKPQKSRHQYAAKLYGFRIHSTAIDIQRRMAADHNKCKLSSTRY